MEIMVDANEWRQRISKVVRHWNRLETNQLNSNDSLDKLIEMMIEEFLEEGNAE